MEKIIILGSGGAGKSTLARKLSKIINIQVFHLDKIFWRPNWVSITQEELEGKIQDIIGLDSWIIDGNYSRTMDIRIKEADTIIFLDFPVWTCLWGITKRRHMYKNKTRPDMTEGCSEHLDWEFIKWVATFPLKQGKIIYEKLNKCSPNKKVIILKSRKQAGKFLEEIEKEYKDGSIY